MDFIRFELLDPLVKVPTLDKDGIGYNIYSRGNHRINPLERKIVLTGVFLTLTDGFYGEVVSSPEMMAQKGLSVVSGLCVSRSEIKLILMNINCLEFLRDVIHNNNAMSGLFGLSGFIQIKPGDLIGKLLIRKIFPESLDFPDNVV